LRRGCRSQRSHNGADAAASRLRRLHFHLQPARSARCFSLLETKKPPHARNLDEAETKDLGGHDGGLSKTAKSRFSSAAGANLRREVPLAAKFFVAALDQAEVKQFLSNDRFSVDGTFIEMWASMKSNQPDLSTVR
jgi:hypothetical protein